MDTRCTNEGTTPAEAVRVCLVYAGPTGSGRSTSLCSVLRQCGVSAPRLIAPGAEYPVKLPDGAEASLAVSGMRSTNGYATPVEGYAHPALRPEFDLLARADAIVFVVLSHSALLDVSAFHFEKLRQDLEFLGRPLDAVPIVFQANKQDVSAARPPSALPHSQLDGTVNGPSSASSCCGSSRARVAVQYFGASSM